MKPRTTKPPQAGVHAAWTVVREAGLPIVLFALAAGLLALGTSRVRDWAVMTDELEYAKLARSIATELSLVPQAHGEPIGALAQVYPLLISPFYGTLDAQEAFAAVHVWNAIVMASVVVPVYLLAREVLREHSRWWAAAAGLLSVAVPWTIIASFVMSEAAAYPAFVWAILLMQRSLAAPSARRDLLALAGMGLAYFARTQFALLVVVLPVAAVVIHGPLGAVRRHRALAAAYVLGAFAVTGMAVSRGAEKLLGRYAVTVTEGSLLTGDLPRAALVHLVVLGAALGAIPLVLGLGWALSAARERSPFAVLAALTIVAIVLQVSSYDLRFGGEAVVRDRYLFYVAPLLLIASVAWLLEERSRFLAAAALTALFLATAQLEAWTPVAGDFAVDRVGVILYALFDAQAGTTPTGVFVGLAGFVVAGAVIGARSRLPRLPVAAVIVGLLFVFLAGETGYGFQRMLGNHAPSGRPLTGDPGRIFDWVDSALPGERDAAIVPYPVAPDWGPSAILWWDVELYNHSVEAAYVIGENFTYSPFPLRRLDLDFATGKIATEAESTYLVVAQGDARLRVAGDRIGASYGLDILKVWHPYRAEWASRGLDDDGYTRPGRLATIRVYAAPGHATESVELSVLVAAPPSATAPARYRLDVRYDEVAPNEARTEVRSVCVPAAGHVDVSLSVEQAGVEPGVPYDAYVDLGERTVGPKVGAIALRRTSVRCRP